MIKYSSCPEFDKDFKKLHKKYPSLDKDFEDLKKIMDLNPIIPMAEQISWLGEEIIIPIYKARKVVCKSLKSNSKIRVIYAYDEASEMIQFIEFVEIYTKSDKDMEDRERIKKYYSNKSSLSAQSQMITNNPSFAFIENEPDIYDDC